MWTNLRSIRRMTSCQPSATWGEASVDVLAAGARWILCGLCAMSKKASYAWDTSVLIAWLCQEAGAPLGDIDLVVDEIDREKSNLILSATTFSEILETKYNPDQLDQLN